MSLSMAMEPTAFPCPQSSDLLAGSNSTQLEPVPHNLAQKHVLDVALTTSLTTILALYANFNFTYLVLAVTKVLQAMALPLLTFKVALLNSAVQMVPQVIPLVQMLIMELMPAT